MNKNKVGLTLGLIMGGLHAVWAILVAFGFAQMLMDWIYSLHFLNNPFIVGQFNLMVAVTLIVVTFIVGYFVGWIFAYLWNMAKKK